MTNQPPLFMATATIAEEYNRAGFGPTIHMPGVVELDRGAIDGDDLDELYERFERGGGAHRKLRVTSYDRQRALDMVTARYRELTG